MPTPLEVILLSDFTRPNLAKSGDIWALTWCSKFLLDQDLHRLIVPGLLPSFSYRSVLHKSALGLRCLARCRKHSCPSTQSHTGASIFPAPGAAVGYRLQGPPGPLAPSPQPRTSRSAPDHPAQTILRALFASRPRLRPPHLPLEKSHAVTFLKPIVSSLPLAYSINCSRYACSQFISIFALWPVERLVCGLML